MAKVKLGDQAYLPMPVTLLGVLVGGRANFMALGWVSRINFQPPMVALGVHQSHHTVLGLKENGAFSLNLPTADMLEITDYCGLVSGAHTDKSGLFELFYGEIEAAPMIAGCPLTMECRVVREVELPTNLLVVGEIVAAYGSEEVLRQGQPDLGQINPLILSMPDNRYWTLGPVAGRAWSAGKKLKAQ